MKTSFFSILILILSALFTPACATDSGLVIEDAWIAEAPPVSKVMVAYMTIRNSAASDIEIIHAESEIYSSIEFHETVHEDGMARMIRHQSLAITAGGRLELKRGGPHLMLFNPVKVLKAGDKVDIILTTRDKVSKTVSVTVKKAQF